jgi:hypothetical protein
MKITVRITGVLANIQTSHPQIQAQRVMARATSSINSASVQDYIYVLV